MSGAVDGWAGDGAADAIVHATAPSPVGNLLLVVARAPHIAGGEALAGVWFETRRHPPRESESWLADDGSSPVLAAARAQLDEYFAGRRTTFDLPLAPRGTPFQRRVWSLLRAIPFAGTATYGDLARRLGDTNATRAVGAANGRNPISIIVPCHRIIGAAGDLTGFGGGIERKRWLLEHEARVAGVPGQLALL